MKIYQLLSSNKTGEVCSSFLLSNPKDPDIITARSAVHIITHQRVSCLRIDDKAEPWRKH